MNLASVVRGLRQAVDELYAMVSRSASGETGGFVNVKSPPYSAEGNGIHDDSAAIQAAVNACAADGRTVWFPDGVYLVDTAPTLPQGTLLRVSPGATFTGPGSTELSPLASPNAEVALGTVSAPSNTSVLSIQPIDPTLGPFSIALHPQLFNSTWDNVLFYGYNALGATATEPAIRLGFEHNYESVPGTHLAELYLEFVSAGATHSLRPIYSYMNRATGITEVALQCLGAPFVFQDVSTAPATQLWAMGVTGTLGSEPSIDMTTGIPIVDVGEGGHPATVGQIRLQPTDWVAWRDLENATNVTVGFSGLDASNAWDIVDSSGTIPIRIQGFPLKVSPYGGGFGGALVVGPAFVLGADQVQVGYQLNPGLTQFTFASDANATLSETQSRANILIVEAGVITVPRTISSFYSPVAGTLIFVRNTNLQNITFAWASGTGVLVPAGTAMLITSDGTNAVKLLQGT